LSKAILSRTSPQGWITLRELSITLSLRGATLEHLSRLPWLLFGRTIFEKKHELRLPIRQLYQQCLTIALL
jgi:hypothetical protein